MKLTGFLVFLVMVGFVFLAISLASSDLNSQFPTNPINTSAYSGRYDATSSLNSSISAIQERFNVITDEDRGFFTRLGAGIVAIPYAVILFPKAVLTGLGALGDMITDFSLVIGIPPAAAYMLIFIATLFIIGLLIKFFQKDY